MRDEVSLYHSMICYSLIILQEPDLNAPPPNHPLNEEVPAIPIYRIRRRQGEPDPEVLITEFVWTQARNIALLRLHPAQQRLHRWLFVYMEGYLFGVHSYPDQQPSIKIEFLACSLRLAAEVTEAPDELKNALHNDMEFIATASKLVSAVVYC